MMVLNLLFSAAILMFLIVIDLYSLKYPFEARLFPWIVGIPATIAMFIHTLKAIPGLGHATGAEALSKQKYRGPRAYALIVAWMAGFLIMIYVLGFFVGIPMFVFLYLKTHGLGWLRSLGLAAGLIIVIYCGFTLGMEMRLFPGLIMSLYVR